MQPLEAVPLADIEAARERIAQGVVRTPLVELDLDTDASIYLKLENLQPIGSFKIRGARNAILKREGAIGSKGVYTASAGNMAQGVAWNARQLGIPCSVVVPEGAPHTKVAAIERLGGSVIKVPFDEWWQVIVTHRFPGLDGEFIHPVSDPDVIAGNATIGMEIFEDLPAVDTVLAPYGGGGLSCGIACALTSLESGASVIACEVETAAPLSASIDAGRPMEIDHTPSFVDGIGGKSVLTEMWPLASTILAGARVASLDAVVAAIKILVERNRVVAEGAGATPVAVALNSPDLTGKVVCIVSGGNIDSSKLASILRGEVP